MDAQLQHRIQHLQSKLKERHIPLHEQFLPVLRYLMAGDKDYQNPDNHFISQTEALKWWREKTKPGYVHDDKTRGFILKDVSKEVAEHYRKKELYKQKKQKLFDAVDQPEPVEDENSYEEPLLEESIPPNTIPPQQYSESLQRIQELRSRKKGHKDRSVAAAEGQQPEETNVQFQTAFADAATADLQAEDPEEENIRENLRQARLKRQQKRKSQD